MTTLTGDCKVWSEGVGSQEVQNPDSLLNPDELMSDIIQTYL